MNNSMYIKQFQSIEVFFLSDGWFNATIAASSFGKDPRNWIRSEEAYRYGKALIKLLNPKKCVVEPHLEMEMFVVVLLRLKNFLVEKF